MSKLINVHSHVFNGKCASKDFLQVALPNVPDGLIKRLKGALESDGGARFLSAFDRLSPNNGNLQKYINFIRIGVQKTQLKTFEHLLEAWSKFDPETRIVALSMDMDHMSDPQNRPEADFRAQLVEVMGIKVKYPNQFFPFFGVDPRTKRGPELVEWVRPFLEKQIFAGIKLYPSLGFFPFDKGLDDLYAYCAERGVPIMTHCTRSGSYYVGRGVVSMIERGLQNTTDPNSHSVIEAKLRFERYKAENGRGWLKKNTWLKNDKACDLFLHPQNYEVLLDKFPGLKLCLAHFGGSDEVLGKNNSNYAPVDPINWYNQIKVMLQKYPNLYTDISYTHANKDALEKIILDIQQSNVRAEQVLFGTDFYMTEREGAEQATVAWAFEKLGQLKDQLCMVNNQRYLGL